MMTNKKILIKRLFIGFPIGVAIGYLMTILFSLIFAEGYYSPYVPDLENSFGSPITIVIIQFLLTGLLGAIFSGSSLIWQIETWSIAKQSLIHFIISASTLLSIAYILHWMTPTLIGIITYLAIFFFIYLSIWLIQYNVWKKKIKELNQSLKEQNKKAS